MKSYQKILEWALLLFTALLGMKFTHGVGTPEVPAFYESNAVSLLYNTAPSFLFVFLSALLLLFTLLLNRKLNTLSLLWLVAVLCSLLGIVNASTPEAVRQILIYLPGLGCFAATVTLHLENDPAFGKKLITAMLAGAGLVLVSGWYQMLFGMQQLETFVAEQGLELDEAMQRQVESSRLYGPFTQSNTFGGYLAAMLPLALAATALWAKNNVKPPRSAIIFLCSTVLIFFAVPLWQTGSRGAVLSLAAGVFLFLFLLLNSRKARLILTACAIAAAAACVCMVLFVRGAESMFFRLDYYLAALKMMLAHPFAGTGWGDFFTDYPALKLLFNDEAPHSPHNLLLFFGAQCGLPGFLAGIALLAVPLFTGYRRARRMYRESGLTDQTVLAAGVLCSLTVLSLNSLIEIGIEVPAYAALLILLAALTCREGKMLPTASQALKVLYPVILALLAVATVFLSFNGMKREAAFSKLHLACDPVFTPKRDPEAILKAYRAAPQDSPYVHFMMATYLTETRNLSAAKDYLDKACSLAPENTGIRWYRVFVSRDLGLDTDEDVRFLRQQDPRNPNLRRLPPLKSEK